jgi:tetraacyldisaccharide 4'-kinase
MLRAEDFREVVSGRRGGLTGPILRGVLRIVESPYSLVVGLRNRRYDLGRANVERVSVPVLSVGNLTLGGTGKTPLVKWLARRMTARGAQPAIVSRGYRSVNGKPNDEALELRQALPDVPHVQNADRVAAARAAIEYHCCNVILLDDGFQHRRLARDLDIVLLDALEPFGFEHVFPRGMLREPLSGLQRADIVCLSRADAVSPEERQGIRSRVAAIAPQVAWCEVSHSPSGLANANGQSQSIASLKGRRVAAFCGIGNPAGFRHTLETAGGEIVAWREYLDHHAYTEADLAGLAKLAERARAEIVVCTHKDLVKIARPSLGELPLAAVVIEIEFLAGQNVMEEAVRKVRITNGELGGSGIEY